MQYIPADKVARVARQLTHRLEARARYIDHRSGPGMAQAAVEFLEDAIGKALDALASLERVPADAAADALTARRMDALMVELAASLPPVRGGGPDDFEELCESFEDDPQGWPEGYDEECDGFTYELAHEEPTPIEVLEASRPTWEPTPEDWADYYSAGAPLVAQG